MNGRASRIRFKRNDRQFKISKIKKSRKIKFNISFTNVCRVLASRAMSNRS